MSKKPTIFAMIPARRGSTRLKQKNLALLNGKPLISYAIDAAKKSGIFDKIIVNSEDSVFADLAKKHGVDFYHRPAELATSDTKSDAVVNDFISKNPCDIVAWVNPTSPLQTGEEIRQVIEYFIAEKCDSLITVKSEQVHAIYDGQPLNFNSEEEFARTQDLKIVGCFVYSVMMWRTKTFVENFKKRGHAILCGKIGYFPVSKLSSIIIKKEEDLRLAEYVVAGMAARPDFELTYERTSS